MSRIAPALEARTITSWPASVSRRETSASVSGSSSTMKNFIETLILASRRPGTRQQGDQLPRACQTERGKQDEINPDVHELRGGGNRRMTLPAVQRAERRGGEEAQDRPGDGREHER